MEKPGKNPENHAKQKQTTAGAHMATLTPQLIVRTGLDPQYTAADVAGDQVANDGRIFLHIKNADASAHTVTVASAATAQQGLAAADLVVSIPASGERMIGGFAPRAWNDAQGNINFTYDAVTSVTIATLRYNDNL
jgi:hypothetical protein